MVKVLFYDMYRANDAGVEGHPQQVMKGLGVTYKLSVPQSISDRWEFWDYSNAPDPLPSYLRAEEMDPFDRIGWGLSKDMAEALVQGAGS